ncbi:hypothetical protein [Nocardia stercoris]|uniref:hypothetical protein n=1 Tax=Nocardia stercoris TaxID=2483361 RepID=UPI00131A175B|nr:hypothetical protein [Nocardia stercoris]
MGSSADFLSTLLADTFLKIAAGSGSTGVTTTPAPVTTTPPAVTGTTPATGLSAY